MNNFKKSIYRIVEEGFSSQVSFISASAYLDAGVYFIGVQLTLANSVSSDTDFVIQVSTAGGVFLSNMTVISGNLTGSDEINTGTPTDPSPITNVCIVSCSNPSIDLSLIGVC